MQTFDSYWPVLRHSQRLLSTVSGVAVLTLLFPVHLWCQEPCIETETDDEYSSERAFDIKFDRNDRGQSFSCDAGFSATKARDVLEAFRYGFLYDSKRHIEQSVSFPLKVHVKETDESTERSYSVSSFSEWVAFKEDNFSAEERALIACATLKNVRIYRRWSGFSIGLGRVWFMKPVDEDPRVTVINIRPLTSDLLLRLCVGGE